MSRKEELIYWRNAKARISV